MCVRGRRRVGVRRLGRDFGNIPIARFCTANDSIDEVTGEAKPHPGVDPKRSKGSIRVFAIAVVVVEKNALRDMHLVMFGDLSHVPVRGGGNGQWSTEKKVENESKSRSETGSEQL